MTLACSRPHFDAAVAHLDLTATLLHACHEYFAGSGPMMATATRVVAELEARAAGPGHPAASVAKRWRTSRVFGPARELRDGLAGVRLMVTSAAVATGNAVGELGQCAESQEEAPVHDFANDLARRTTGAHVAFLALGRHLESLDGIFRDLRTEPWSLPDRLIVEQLRRRVASGDLTRARRELAHCAELLAEVEAKIST
jgi:hypothetical protein